MPDLDYQPEDAHNQSHPVASAIRDRDDRELRAHCLQLACDRAKHTSQPMKPAEVVAVAQMFFDFCTGMASLPKTEA